MGKKKQPKQEQGKFIRIDRNRAEEIAAFLFNIGNQYVNLKNPEAAKDCFSYSLDLNPRSQAAVHNLGALYDILGNTEGAIRMFREAWRMRPSDTNSPVALAASLRKIGNTEEALEIVDKILEVDPKNFTAMSVRGVSHYDEGRLSQALDSVLRALEFRPADLGLILNKALIRMVYGHWAEEWKNYEFVLSYHRNERMAGMSMSSAWAGEERPDKTLVVVSDQGSGDAIQMSRYIEDVKRIGKFKTIIFLVQPDLVPLMQRLPYIDVVVGFGEAESLKYDEYSALLGVMRVLQVTPDTCYRPPHIVTDPALDEVWESRLRALVPAHDDVVRVGICWAGDPRHGNDHNRSIALKEFFRLAVPGVQLYSFQVGKPILQLKAIEGLSEDGIPSIIDLGSNFRTYDDTASALRQMDFVVTCDTSVAHLGGCMGIPTFVALPLNPEWRWLLDESEARWYADVRLFRQTKRHEWSGVFNAMRAEIEAVVRGRSNASTAN